VGEQHQHQQWERVGKEVWVGEQHQHPQYSGKEGESVCVKRESGKGFGWVTPTRQLNSVLIGGGVGNVTDPLDWGVSKVRFHNF